MSDPFSTFSFVDRIIDVEAGKRARGCFLVPAQLPHFSPCLVVEAVGQLAAWVAMARDDFQRRPVAALAGEGCIMGAATPGGTIELGVDVEEWDQDAVSYAGWARMSAVPIIELRNCVGALLPLEDFDAPDAARRRFVRLCQEGAQPGCFRGVDAAHVVMLEREPGQRLRGSIQVPASAPFFADHFPRRSVFPATLLLEAQIRMAVDLAREVFVGANLRAQRVMNVKMRAFILPGQVVEMTAEKRSQVDGTVAVALAAKVGGKRVATARVDVVAHERL